jgi:hypothetical protein
LLLTAGPAQASPIRFADVIAQAVATSVGGQQTFDLRLRTLPQSGRTTLSTPSGTQTQNPANDNPNQGQTQTPSGAGSASITNTEVQPTLGQGGNVEVVQLGDVTGTVCDCGEILLPEAHHFPKLPFLALAAVPLLFIPHGNNETPTESTPTPTPTPTPNTTPVPEPTTLLLLGSGLVVLSARARRRRATQLRRLAELTSAGEV